MLYYKVKILDGRKRYQTKIQKSFGHVDWKGSMNNKIKINPSLNELKTHFEHILPMIS